MKRVLVRVALLALALPVWALAQSAPAVHTLSIATLAPDGSTWMRVCDAWNRELRRRSGSQLQFRFYSNGVQGDEGEVVRKIRQGRVDGGALTAVGLAQIHRPTVAFQIPGLFDNYQQLDRARDALRPELDAAFLQAGYVMLGWGDLGTERIFATRAIRTPADFARTRPFVWNIDPVFPAFVAQTGASGVTMDLPDVLGSLPLHTIDNIVASPLSVASLQWAPYLPHMTDMPMGTDVGAMIVSRRAFDSLPHELQTVLMETAGQFTRLMVHNVRRDDDATVPQMQARGLIVDTLTPAERAQWQAVFAGTRARLAGTIGTANWIQRILDLAHSSS